MVLYNMLIYMKKYIILLNIELNFYKDTKLKLTDETNRRAIWMV